jgi:hypothetical protein
MFRDSKHAFEVWGAFPPPWVRFVPTAWLAGFVDRSAEAPGRLELATAIGLLGLTLVVGALAVGRIGQMYRQMGPALTPRRLRRMKPERVGGLDLAAPASWLDTEHRVGFWLGRRLLGREPNFTIRCLIPLNTALAVMILGLATGQFANPLVDRTPSRVVLPILSVYLMVLAVPPIVYNLGFCRDSDASWILRTAPLERAGRVGLGLCQGVLAWLLLPLCGLWCLVAAIAWRDPLSALLHGGLVVALAWPTALASLAIVLDGPPLSRPPVRAGSSGPLVLPMAAFSTLAMLAVGLHYWQGRSPLFWLGAATLAVVASLALAGPAERRVQRLMEATP